MFEQLGAKLDADRARELLGRVQTRRTFVFTDIVDSTRLLETLGDEKWKKLLARHDELLRERIGEHGGEVIKNTATGSSPRSTTRRPRSRPPVAIQRALDAEIVAPDVRIGVHAGARVQDGDRLRRPGRPRRGTIGAAAGASEILVSKETLDGVGGAFRLSEPREETLQGVDRPIDAVTVAWR